MAKFIKKLFGGGSSPKPAPVSQGTKYISKSEAEREAYEKRRARGQARERGGKTIFTTPLGLQSGANIAKKYLG